MNLPAAMAGLAAGTLEPAFSPAVDVAREEIPALAAVLGSIGLRNRGHRAARPGLRILPMLAGILVTLAQDIGGGVAGKGKVAVGRRRFPLRDRAGEVAVVDLGERSLLNPPGKRAAVVAREAASAGAEPD